MSRPFLSLKSRGGRIARKGLKCCFRWYFVLCDYVGDEEMPIAELLEISFLLGRASERNEESQYSGLRNIRIVSVIIPCSDTELVLS